MTLSECEEMMEICLGGPRPTKSTYKKIKCSACMSKKWK